MSQNQFDDFGESFYPDLSVDQQQLQEFADQVYRDVVRQRIERQRQEDLDYEQEQEQLQQEQQQQEQQPIVEQEEVAVEQQAQPDVQQEEVAEPLPQNPGEIGARLNRDIDLWRQRLYGDVQVDQVIFEIEIMRFIFDYIEFSNQAYTDYEEDQDYYYLRKFLQIQRFAQGTRIQEQLGFIQNIEHGFQSSLFETAIDFLTYLPGNYAIQYGNRQPAQQQLARGVWPVTVLTNHYTQFQVILQTFCQTRYLFLNELRAMYSLNFIEPTDIMNKASENDPRFSQLRFSDILYTLQGYSSLNVLRLLYLFTKLLRQEDQQFINQIPMYIVFVLQAIDKDDIGQVLNLHNKFLAYFKKSTSNHMKLQEYTKNKYNTEYLKLFYGKKSKKQIGDYLNDNLVRVYDELIFPLGNKVLPVNTATFFFINKKYDGVQHQLGQFERQINQYVDESIRHLYGLLQSEDIGWYEFYEESLNVLRNINVSSFTSDKIFIVFVQLYKNLIRQLKNVNGMFEQGRQQTFAGRIVYRVPTKVLNDDYGVDINIPGDSTEIQLKKIYQIDQRFQIKSVYVTQLVDIFDKKLDIKAKVHELMNQIYQAILEQLEMYLIRERDLEVDFVQFSQLQILFIEGTIVQYRHVGQQQFMDILETVQEHNEREYIHHNYAAKKQDFRRETRYQRPNLQRYYALDLINQMPSRILRDYIYRLSVLGQDVREFENINDEMIMLSQRIGNQEQIFFTSVSINQDIFGEIFGSMMRDADRFYDLYEQFLDLIYPVSKINNAARIFCIQSKQRVKDFLKSIFESGGDFKDVPDLRDWFTVMNGEITKILRDEQLKMQQDDRETYDLIYGEKIMEEQQIQEQEQEQEQFQEDEQQEQQFQEQYEYENDSEEIQRFEERQEDLERRGLYEDLFKIREEDDKQQEQEQQQPQIQPVQQNRYFEEGLLYDDDDILGQLNQYGYIDDPQQQQQEQQYINVDEQQDDSQDVQIIENKKQFEEGLLYDEDDFEQFQEQDLQQVQNFQLQSQNQQFQEQSQQQSNLLLPQLGRRRNSDEYFEVDGQIFFYNDDEDSFDQVARQTREVQQQREQEDEDKFKEEQYLKKQLQKEKKMLKRKKREEEQELERREKFRVTEQKRITRGARRRDSDEYYEVDGQIFFYNQDEDSQEQVFNKRVELEQQRQQEEEEEEEKNQAYKKNNQQFFRDKKGIVTFSDQVLENIFILKEYRDFYVRQQYLDNCYIGVMCYFLTVINPEISELQMQTFIDYNLFRIERNQENADIIIQIHRRYMKCFLRVQWYLESRNLGEQYCLKLFDCFLQIIGLFSNVIQLGICFNTGEMNYGFKELQELFKNDKKTYVLMVTDCHMFLSNLTVEGCNDLQNVLIYVNNFSSNVKLQKKFIESDKEGKLKIIKDINFRLRKKEKTIYSVDKIKVLTKYLKKFKGDRKNLNKQKKMKEKLNFAMYLKKKMFCYVFFDFETTNVSQKYYNEQGYAEIQQKNENHRQQQSFCVAYIIDCYYPIKKYGQLLSHNYQNLKNLKNIVYLKDFVFNKRERKYFWGLDCANQFVSELLNLQNSINESISLINELIQRNDTNQDLCKYHFIQFQMDVMSYNGSRFDNHFILRALRDLVQQQWYKHISFIGDLNDLKIMQYQQIRFLDLQLMTGGGSLNNMCKDYLNEQKHDIDIDKMKYWEDCQINKQEIVKYCLQDTILLLKLFYKFKDCIVDIVYDYLLTSLDDDQIEQMNENEELRLIEQEQLDSQVVQIQDLNSKVTGSSMKNINDFSNMQSVFDSSFGFKTNFDDNSLFQNSEYMDRLKLNQKEQEEDSIDNMFQDSDGLTEQMNNLDMNSQKSQSKHLHEKYYRRVNRENSDNEGEDLNFQLKDKKVLRKLIELEFKIWTTISTLSYKIFKDYFNEFELVSSKEQDVYQFFRNAYFGGYTQSFYIGEVYEPFYLDFNSMYPYIQNMLKFPVNYSYKVSKFLFNAKVELYIKDLKTYFICQNIPYNIDTYEYSDPLKIENNIGDRSEFFNLVMEEGDYNLFQITQFTFFDYVYAPWIPIRTKDYGTIYPLDFSVNDQNQKLQDQCKFGVVVFGFQLKRSLQLKEMKFCKVNQIYKFTKNEFILDQRKGNKGESKFLFQQIFQNFDNYLYQQRLKVKNTNNALACNLKTIINSLYGKFGQKIFDTTFVMELEESKDMNILNDKIQNSIMKNPQVDYDYVKKKSQEDPDYIGYNIKRNDIHDFTNRIDQQQFVQITVQDLPLLTNHIGSFTYIPALITAMGRTLIQRVINISRFGRDQAEGLCNGQVFYGDTDSLVMDNQGFQNILNEGYFMVDDGRLGALKNEFKLDGMQYETNIQQMNILNKKMYQVLFKKSVKGQMSKETFKGVKDNFKDEEATKLKKQMFDQFKQKGCFKINQVRFQRKNGNVDIFEQDMSYYLRLSRRINDQNNDTKKQSFEIYLRKMDSGLIGEIRNGGQSTLGDMKNKRDSVLGQMNKKKTNKNKQKKNNSILV